MRPHAGALARICRAAFAAIAIAAFIAAPWPGHDAAHAHEGHDHADKPAAGAAALASPRVVAVSESYQFVGIVEGEVLVVYLDRAADNAPVTSATIEVTLNGQAFKAEPQANGTYEVTAPILKQAGPIEVLATIADAGQSDLLVGGLVIAASTPSRDSPNYIALWTGMPKALGQDGRLILAGLGAGLVVGAIGVYAWRRRAASTALLAALLVVGLAAAAAAHDGHDHGADIRASGGNNPQRRPDGAIFLPKPTQRLLDVRTATVQIETATRAVRLAGRVAANPNFSGVVQSTIPGRYEAPAGGVPPLGSRVKVGDLMGRVAPSFASIDSSDMAQTLGDIDQRLSIARAKLARQEQLLRSNVVASALVDETRMEVDGLVKRRTDLLAARVRSEELRAPVDGIIAATRVVAGQVVTQSDRLFEIVDPARLLVEALVFDQLDPDAVGEASAAAAGDTNVQLRYLGRSRALQQQYALMQFEVVASASALSVGMPVTVVARTGAPMSGLFLPRTALAQAPNGQTVVFEHREPEVFVPRPVRTEPFDSQTVLVTGGLAAGAKIVVKNAPLVSQVR
jgi:membrane fusion protein, heavy metal efflux system